MGRRVDPDLHRGVRRALRVRLDPVGAPAGCPVCRPCCAPSSVRMPVRVSAARTPGRPSRLPSNARSLRTAAAKSGERRSAIRGGALDSDFAVASVAPSCVFRVGRAECSATLLPCRGDFPCGKCKNGEDVGCFARACADGAADSPRNSTGARAASRRASRRRGSSATGVRAGVADFGRR